MQATVLLYYIYSVYMYIHTIYIAIHSIAIPRTNKKAVPNKYLRLQLQNINRNDFGLIARQLKPKITHGGVQWKKILRPGYHIDIQNRQL